MGSKAAVSRAGTESPYIDRLAALARQKGTESLPSELQAYFPPPTSQWNEVQTEDVKENPTLQSELARRLDYSPSKWLLEQEAPRLREIRRLHAHGNPANAQLPEYPGDDKDIYEWAREGQLSGLCLSGGGIRSATFNLGILQGLAAHGKLGVFDYLSSVSGGGYIHSWLAAWLNRQAEEEFSKTPATPRDKAMRDGFVQVTEKLCPPPRHSSKTWPRQIEWLRKYSNYLTPEVGLLTGDTWAMVAMWIRNVSLNQCLLLSIFALMLMLPHVLAYNDWVIAPPRPVATASKTIATVQSSDADAELVLQLRVPAAPASDHTSKTVSSFVWNDLRACPRIWFSERPSWWGCGGLTALALGIVALCLLLWREYTRTREPDMSERAVADAVVEREAAGRELQQAESRLVSSDVTDNTEKVKADAEAAQKRFNRASKSLAAAKAAQQKARTDAPRPVTRRLRHEWWLALGSAIVPLFVFGLCISYYVILEDPDLEVLGFALLVELGLLVWIGTFAGGALIEWNYRAENQKPSPPTGYGKQVPRVLRGVGLVLLGTPAAIAGATGGIGIAILLRSSAMSHIANWLYLNSPGSTPRAVQIVFGTALFSWLPMVTLVIAAGLIGRWFPDWLAEWLARIRGYSLLAGLGWTALCGTSLLMPGVVAHAFHSGWIKWPAVLMWAGSTIGSVIAGKSPKTSGDKDGSSSPGILSVLLLAGPYVYMIGVMVTVAWVLNAVHAHLTLAHVFWLVCLLVPGSIALIFGFTLDINEFSMHSFYRNRLTRCYLGASNLHRDPSRVTGFDDRDTRGLQVARLLPDGPDPSPQRPYLYPGPFPIFCCSMNITQGEDLGWQERKAASFAFTPLYSGYEVPWPAGTRSQKVTYNGFVPTHTYAYPGGPNLATAMAASGAAISPNWGYHTNPALAFLLTMFDVRLGWWIANPRRSCHAGQTISNDREELDYSSPRFVPLWLGQELLGSIKDTSAYIYLTDGGHFDNMGLYELVRRRCYRIVICDAEEDASYIYEGIGNAIRKCRIDFGVEINLDLSSLTPNTASKLSPAHVAYGTIRYPETPDKTEGTVIYIKASLTGKAASTQTPEQPFPGSVSLPDVPGDVQNYKLQHAAFPHDSTLNQWFTESQFESYRRLGQTVAECVFGK